MKVRPYRDSRDLEAMQGLAAAAIAVDPDCFLLHPGDIPHRLFNGMKHDDPADFVTLWEDASGLSAWTAVYARRWHSFDVQIRPERRGELERTVLAHAEERLLGEMARSGVEADRMQTDVDRCDSFRAGILEEMGWDAGEHEYTVTRRSLVEIPDSRLPEGFVVRSVRGPEEAAAVAEVHAASFGSEWTPELYAKVMHSPGYDAGREFVVEAPAGRLTAFTVTWHDHHNQLGLFEPVGTHEEFRRIGLGRAVMVAGMRSMRAAGMEAAIVTYEVTNPASAALYTSLGFEPFIESIGYAKPIRP